MSADPLDALLDELLPETRTEFLEVVWGALVRGVLSTEEILDVVREAIVRAGGVPR